MREDKGRWSKIYRRMWNDERFRALSAAPPNGQTLFIRLLTGPELTNIPGVFSVGEAGLAEALGWDRKGFREAFGEAFREGLAKADWDARFVFVPKAIAYNRPESPNVVRSWKTLWAELPECPLKAEAYQVLKAFVEGLGEGYAKAFREAFGEALPESRAGARAGARAGDTDDGRAHGGAPSGMAPAAPVLTKARRERVAPLEASWVPPVRMAAAVTARGLSVPRILEDFRDYWTDPERGGEAKRTPKGWAKAFANNVAKILRTPSLREDFELTDGERWFAAQPPLEPEPEPEPCSPEAAAKIAATIADLSAVHEARWGTKANGTKR